MDMNSGDQQPTYLTVLCAIQIIICFEDKLDFFKYVLDLSSSPIICGTRTTAVKDRKRKLSGCIPTVLRGKQAGTKK